MQTFDAEVHQVVLDAETVAGLKQLGRAHQTTLYMTLLAGFGVLLGRYSGQDDIVVGTPIANRQDAQLEDLIGFFVNTLALRLDVQPAQSVASLLAAVRHTTLEAYRYQDVPFERMVEAVAPQRRLDRSPVFQVFFVADTLILIERAGAVQKRILRHLEINYEIANG